MIQLKIVFFFIATFATTTTFASHQQEDGILICQKNLNTPIAMPFAAFHCAAEALGGNFNSTKPKLPESFVKTVDSRLARVNILKDLNSFHNWFCKDFNFSVNLINSHPEFNFTDDQIPKYMKCYHDKLTETINDEICVKKNILAQNLESEKFKCMISSLGRNNPCLNDVLGKSLKNSNQVTSWLCSNETHPERFVVAEMMCAVGHEESSEKFSDCMDSIAKRLVKN